MLDLNCLSNLCLCKADKRNGPKLREPAKITLTNLYGYLSQNTFTVVVIGILFSGCTLRAGKWHQKQGYEPTCPPRAGTGGSTITVMLPCD